MLLTKSNTLLLVGSANKKAFIAEIDQSGNIVWQKLIEAQANVLLDVIETNSGFAVVGGKVGTPPFFSVIWVGEISTKGELKRSLTLPGAAGFSASISQAIGGQYAIAYDRKTGEDESAIYQVVAQGLDREFHPTWNQIYSSAYADYALVKLSKVISGGYVLAVANRNLSVSKIQADGTTSWTHTTKVAPPDYPRFNGIDLFNFGQDFILASGLSVVNDRTQEQVVKVTKFSVQ